MNPKIMVKLASVVKAASLPFAVCLFASAVSAAPTITIDRVVQRWPWNNKVDITYTVAEGQDVAAGVYARLVFTASIGATNIVIDGVHDVGANASDGTHTVTWTLPPGLRASDCTMSAQLFSADYPSGDDYMIVDLDTGAITYEGLLASQDASSARYNTSLYKSTNSANKCCMVLRKVPAGGPYPTGDDTHYSGSNSAKEWTTDRAYYIGVFPVTQYQYAKIGADTEKGPTPSTYKKQATNSANVKEERPVDSVSWRDLRLTDTAPTSPIPAVASCEGTFFQRLNYLTGYKFGFDLPTEVMFEIVERAGAKTTYFWGDDMDTRYVVCKANADATVDGDTTTSPVGSRLSNSWGIFDMAGNIWEWCRDAYTADNLALRTDAFTPVAVGNQRVMRGGGTKGTASDSVDFRASYRTNGDPWVRAGYVGGFRVAFVVD